MSLVNDSLKFQKVILQIHGYKEENVRHCQVTKTLKQVIFLENPGIEGVVSDMVSVFFSLITVFLEQMTLVPYDTNFYLMIRESSIS